MNKMDGRECPNDNPNYSIRVVGKWGWCGECCNMVNGKCIIGKPQTEAE